MRNKIPRVPGQGEYHRGKILASVTGSLPGGLGSLQDDATSEFFGGSGFSAWPNPLPASGTQTAYDIIIPPVPKINADVVHAHTPYTLGLHATGMKVKKVVTAHFLPYHFLEWAFGAKQPEMLEKAL